MLVVDEGYGLEQALRRAADRHGVRLRPGQPDAASLAEAIREYRELFRPQSMQRLQAQRRFALQAMDALAELAPRLAGPLVRGDGPLDLIRLLVVAESPEQVALQLSDRHIPWQAAEVTLLHSGGQRKAHPALRFIAGDNRVELVVLGEAQRADPPRDPVGGGRLQTLDREQLAQLVAQT